MVPHSMGTVFSGHVLLNINCICGGFCLFIWSFIFFTCLTENDGRWGHWVVGNDGACLGVLRLGGVGLSRRGKGEISFQL